MSRPLWRDTDEKIAKAAGRWFSPRFVLKIVRTYVALLRAYWPLRSSYDVMVLGYTGQFDTFIARPLTWLAHRPLVLDLCMSLYLIVMQRGLGREHRFTSRVIYGCEWLACRLPDLLILDTPEYVQYFCDTYGISADRFRLVPAGADDQIFRPLPQRTPDHQFRVVFHGTFIPNGHGIEVILRAADCLRDHPEISFELIGEGQDKAAAVALAESLALSNIEFAGWVPKAELPTRLAQADIILGVFGTTAHVFLTIPNKIFEGLAMRKPVITRDGPAVRHTLQHGEDLYLVDSAEPAALAPAILNLQADRRLCERLSQNGYATIVAKHTLAGLGQAICTAPPGIAGATRSRESLRNRMDGVSIIIPSLNSLVIDQVTAAIHEQTCQPNDLEVLVVGLDEHHLVHEDAQMRFISTGIPVSPARARNIGWKMARNDAIIFLDSDCIPRTDWLEEMASYIEQHENVGAVLSGMDFDTRNFWTTCDQVAVCHEHLAWNRSGPRSMLPSYALFIPRHVLEETGGFDEAFLRPAGEDTDLTLRIGEAHYRLLINTKAVVTHRPPRATFSALWRHSYMTGRESIKVRLHYRGKYNMPAWSESAWGWRVLSLPIAIIKTIQILSCPPQMWRYILCFPFVVLAKVGWCLGAADSLSSLPNQSKG